MHSCFFVGKHAGRGDADAAGDGGWCDWLWDGAGADADIGHPGGGSGDSDVRDLDVDFSASWHANEGWNGTGIAATLISLVIALMIPFGVFNFNGVIVGFIVYLILEHFWPSESRNN